MRILSCSIDFCPKDGGISRYTYEVSRALKARGHDVSVVATRVDGDEAFDANCVLPVHRTAFSIAPMDKTIGSMLRELRHFAGAFRLLRRVIKQRDIEAVLCFHWRIFGPMAMLLARLTGVRFLLVGHGLELAPYTPRPLTGVPPRERVRNAIANPIMRVHWRLKSATFRGADDVFTTSAFVASIVDAMGVPEDRIHITGCGVDLDKFAPADDDGRIRERLGLGDRRVILTVSRLIRRKGIDVAIRAFSRVVKEVDDAVLVIVGRGPYESELRRIVADRHLNDRVVFAGFVPDDELVSYYNTSELFLLPCREIPGGDVEGFGIVFLEAGACAKPVVAGRSGGVTEAVEDGVSGLLVDPRDENEIANTLIRCLTDGELAKSLAAGGRRRVETGFTWDVVGERIHQVLTAPARRS